MKRFALKIARMLKLPVEFVDETLTSFEADLILSQKKKRNNFKNDALAAALILEYFLDERGWNV